MNTNNEYSESLLQRNRPQAMYDKNVNRLLGKIFSENPADNHNIVPEFKETFLSWLENDKLNKIGGYKDGFAMDLCIGCTQFIDDIYQTEGAEKIMIFAGDYLYHWRLNQSIIYTKFEDLEPGKQLIIAMPFPSIGDIHPQMSAILEKCLKLKIPVHIDAAWLGCSRDITFDFSHPAIQSFAISLSKGLGLGGHRIAVRFSRQRKPGPITIMNDFNMNCQSLVHVGNIFMKQLGPNYFWNKYKIAYEKVCQDFNLKPTKAIHLAFSPEGPVGIRPLLRFLADK